MLLISSYYLNEHNDVLYMVGYQLNSSCVYVCVCMCVHESERERTIGLILVLPFKTLDYSSVCLETTFPQLIHIVNHVKVILQSKHMTVTSKAQSVLFKLVYLK